MALMHDGLRQNIKLSDARTSLQDISGSGSTTQPIKLSELGAYNLGKTNLFGVNYAIGDCYKPSSGAMHGYRATTASQPGTFVVEGQDECMLMETTQGRYKTTNASAPSIVSLAVRSSNAGAGPASNISMGNLVGLSQCPIPTDTCGQTRGVKGGYSTNVQVHAPSQFSGIYDIHDGTNLSGTSLGSGKSPMHGVTSANLAYSVVQTYHNNQWTHIGLNTICTTGDRIVVMVCSGGGTMYTFTGDPIYLRTTGNSSVSASISTIQAPSKNETGTDTWTAVYTAVCNADGAASVGINPYHSSTQRYQFHIFVIKGGGSAIPSIGLRFAGTKYTSQTYTPTYDHGASMVNALTYSREIWSVVATMSPFTSNGQSFYPTPTIPNDKNVQIIFSSNNGSGQTGAWFVSINGDQLAVGNHYVGKYLQTAIHPNMPQYARMIPTQDAALLGVHGSRG